MAMLDDELLEMGETEEPVQKGRSSRIIIWLLVLSLAGLFVPLFLSAAAIRQENADLQADMAHIQQTIDSQSQPDPEQQTMEQQLIDARDQYRSLEALETNLQNDHIDWPTVMAVISNFHQAEMMLTSLVQTDGRALLLRGQAPTEGVVMSYAGMLEESGQFSRVIVQSISLKTLPTPTPAPTPTGVAVTTTAVSADAVMSSTPTPASGGTVVEFVILAGLAEVNHDQ